MSDLVLRLGRLLRSIEELATVDGVPAHMYGQHLAEIRVEAETALLEVRDHERAWAEDEALCLEVGDAPARVRRSEARGLDGAIRRLLDRR